MIDLAKTGLALKAFPAAVMLCITMVLPSTALSRVNSLTTGLSFSYDYSDRTYLYDNADEEEIAENQDDDDYSTIAATPMVHFYSKGSRDHFEFKAAPKIKYDLLDYNTDWDSDLKVAASRYFTRTWQLEGSNHFIRSDYQDDAIEDDSGTTDTTPELSSDPGRDRYWRNVLLLYSRYFYAKGGLIELGGEYTALRNEDEEFGSYDDYDRYLVSLKNEHQLSRYWKTMAKFSFIRGDYFPEEQAAGDDTESDEALSEDVREYRFSTSVTNNSWAHTSISASYDFISSKYDEEEQEDVDIHQARVTWYQRYSPQFNTTIGLGPSYGKTEGRDANLGGNGVVSLNYQTKRTSCSFSIEKDYDVENFSGTTERGFIDYWNVSLSYRYQLLRALSISSGLGYRYEDWEEPLRVDNEVLAAYNYAPGTQYSWDELYDIEEYNKQIFTARVAMEYSFSRNYKTSISYTFKKQESEQPGDDYDDHRVLLKLSWEQKILQW